MTKSTRNKKKKKKRKKERWVPKNWCFWTVVLEKTLESPMFSKEIQSILTEISPEYSLEGLMLKLKLQYFGHLIRRADSFKKTDSGKEWRWEEKGMTEDETVGWHHWLDGWVWVNSRSWWWTGRPGVLQSMRSQRVGHNWATELRLRKHFYSNHCPVTDQKLKIQKWSALLKITKLIHEC